jgi:hypothetical protein
MNDAAGMHPIDARLADPIAFFGDGQSGIGFVGPDVPIDVLLAAQRPFGHLPWRADGVTPWADRWLESSFPFWARSILEQWHDGCFDALDTVVFSRADDASQRLYYYTAELRRRGKLAGPTPGIFDVSFVPRESGLAHTAAAITDLMARLEVSAGSLPGAIARANRVRQQFAVIEDMRSDAGPAYERLGRAALWTDPAAWIEDVTLIPAERDRPRVLLTGSTPPDDRLHEVVEAAGATVVAEVHALAAARLGPEVDPDGEAQALTIARQIREASVAPRAFFDRAGRLLERAKAEAADAVLIWLTREEEGLAWTLPAQIRALMTAGIPVLAVSSSRWQLDDSTAERITGFLSEVSA